MPKETPMSNPYDVIVLGARCAGSPTAMLLARKGYRVLVVDRATFPSDTISTHIAQPRAVAALARWGLLDRLRATGCPPMHTYTFDFGPVRISGSPGTPDSPVAYCPRRTVLDKLLVDAAVEAGAEVRERFTVEDILFEDDAVVGVSGRSSGGATVTERARIVVGADGRYSRLAEAVKPPQYNEKPLLLSAYYTYWSNLPVDGHMDNYIRPLRGFAVAPTHDGLTVTVGGWPFSEFEANKKDVEGNFLALFDLVPSFADRIRAAKRETPIFGAVTPNIFRKPYGPGWALVGDAGYIRDPITAQGISDAFRDAERCAAAVDEVLTGKRLFDDAMGAYQRDRDEYVGQIYEFTCMLATLEPPPPQMQQLIGAIQGNQEAMDAFAQMNAGTISPSAFGAAVAAAMAH
jgi:2-polyprenyl-6-methoxyphenol hydroxylase-like FAD-dependent oxidoreductase